ncbi:MAG: Cytochrome c oxidase subunit [Actinomycetota bacterium]|jgi:hypothetical protein|nr:Cytochrome c oxidase subunit [Actinomycetota bacterium]
MAEEVRFFLRTAIYTVLIAVIYWFVSYEEAGTVLFGFVAASALIFIVVTLRLVPRARAKSLSPKALVGFYDRPEDEAHGPLEVDEDAFPVASGWPILAAVAAALAGLGAIFGAWLWVPGLALGLSTLVGWTTEA